MPDDAPAVQLHAVTLVVPDYDEALAHYVGDLGFVLVEDTDLGDGKRWVRVSPDPSGAGTSFLLARATTDDQSRAIGRQTGGRVGFFLHTTQFDEVHARLLARGVTVVDGPRDEPYGRVLVFHDRFGTAWDLIEPARVSR